MPGVFLWHMFFQLLFKNHFSLVINQDIAKSSKSTNTPFDFDNSRPLQGIEIFLTMPSTAIRSQRKVESDIYYAYSKSAEALGAKVREFDRTPTLASSMRPQITEENPDSARLVIIDGNEAPGTGNSSRSFLNKVRNAVDFVIVDIPDCYESRNGGEKILQWIDYADILIIHNSRFLPSKFDSEKVLFWPGFPFLESNYFSSWNQKETSIQILGYQHRQREMYVYAGLQKNLPIRNSLHNNVKSANMHPKYDDYISELTKSKFHFSNGYISNKESIIVGRVIEAITAGSALLYETGSDIEFVLNPYRHFVPVVNVPDFIEKSLFLIENEDIAESIALEGRRFYINSYGSRRFWITILQRLGFMR